MGLSKRFQPEELQPYYVRRHVLRFFNEYVPTGNKNRPRKRHMKNCRDKSNNVAFDKSIDN